MAEQGKFNISFGGSVDRSSIAIGDYNTLVQTNALTPAEADELRRMFESLRGEVAAKATPASRDAAVEQAAELERAVVAGNPDPGRVTRALRWFRDHAPEVAGAVASVVLTPVVGKLVEGAGAELAKQLFGDDAG